MTEPHVTHVGIYHGKTTVNPMKKKEERWYDPRGQRTKGLDLETQLHAYEIYAGTGGPWPDRNGMRKIRTVPIPPALLGILNEKYKSGEKLGEVSYALASGQEGKKTAVELQNYPKGDEELFGQATRGFGSFLGLIILRHFMETNVTHVRPSFYRTGASRKQHGNEADRTEWTVGDLEKSFKENILKKLGPDALNVIERL